MVGAGDYEFSLCIVDDPNNHVAVGELNEIIDGCKVTRELQEDTRYMVVVKSLGNEKYNNRDAVSATEANFSTLLEATIIPDGTDLYVYFQNNPIPQSDEEQAYELVAGGNYTISDVVDFATNQLTLRGDKVSRPTVTYGAGGRISTTAGLKLKFINFDCSAQLASDTDAAFILLSGTPDPAILGTGSYYSIMYAISVQSCTIKGVNRHFLYDNKKKYFVKNFIIKDCIAELNTTQQYIFFNQGYINDLAINSSTFHGYKTSVSSYFIQYNNSGRPDRAGFANGSFTITQNTFYCVAYNKYMGNYSGMNNKMNTFNLEQNLFEDCGNKEVTRRISGNGANMIKTYIRNGYWYDGAFPNNEITHNYGDKSGTHLDTDPQLADPTNLNFTVGSAAHIATRCGDPRWLPAE